MPAIELSNIAAGIGGFVISGQCMQGLTGSSGAAAGDINGDGLADVIAGVVAAGRSYVVFGKTGGNPFHPSRLSRKVTNGLNTGLDQNNLQGCPCGLFTMRSRSVNPGYESV